MKAIGTYIDSEDAKMVYLLKNPEVQKKFFFVLIQRERKFVLHSALKKKFLIDRQAPVDHRLSALLRISKRDRFERESLE